MGNRPTQDIQTGHHFRECLFIIEPLEYGEWSISIRLDRPGHGLVRIIPVTRIAVYQARHKTPRTRT
jgi:hypothetical protein